MPDRENPSTRRNRAVAISDQALRPEYMAAAPAGLREVVLEGERGRRGAGGDAELGEMFWRWRATVCSLMRRAPATPCCSSPTLRGAAPPARAARARGRRRHPRSAATSGFVPRRSKMPRAASNSNPAAPRRRGRDRPRRQGPGARISYGASSACQMSPALLSAASADCASPSASSTAPRAWATMPSSIALSYPLGDLLGSPQARRALSMSPTASMISTYAGSRRTRSRTCVAPISARRIAVAAASVRPWPSRNCARPGCGSQPSALASLYAFSAAPNAPWSRRKPSPAVTGEARSRIRRLEKALPRPGAPPPALRARSRRVAGSQRDGRGSDL